MPVKTTGKKTMMFNSGQGNSPVRPLTDMRIKTWKYALIILALAGCIFATWIVAKSWKQEEWFDLQKQQLATIERLGKFPPPGCNQAMWHNALVTPYNVWGNVTYHPDYSKLSNEEMRTLLGQLEQIVAETSPANSIKSVDRVFELLLHSSQKKEFIDGYREEFRTYGDTFAAYRIDEQADEHKRE